MIANTCIEVTGRFSPDGDQPPIDPKSDEPGNQTDAVARFKKRPRKSSWRIPSS